MKYERLQSWQIFRNISDNFFHIGQQSLATHKTWKALYLFRALHVVFRFFWLIHFWGKMNYCCLKWAFTDFGLLVFWRSKETPGVLEGNSEIKRRILGRDFWWNRFFIV